jgi:hypothetical protein
MVDNGCSQYSLQYIGASVRNKEPSLVLCAPKLLYTSYMNKKQETMCLPDPSNQHRISINQQRISILQSCIPIGALGTTLQIESSNLQENTSSSTRIYITLQHKEYRRIYYLETGNPMATLEKKARYKGEVRWVETCAGVAAEKGR